MSWKEKVVAVYKRFGAPVKFAAKLVVGAFVPGGSAVVDLIGQALDCVHETVKDNIEIDESRLPAATAADLKRVEEMLDVLGGDLAGLTEQIAALEGLPEAATKILDVALKTDDRCRAALHKLDALAQGFDALKKQNAELLRGQGYSIGMQEQMLPLMQRTAGVADFVDELRAAGLTAREFAAALAEIREGIRALEGGRVAEANARLEKLAQAHPTSAAAAVAVAAAQTAKMDLSGAQKTLVRAVRLRPNDAELAELHQRVTRATGTTPPPPPPPGPQPPTVGAVLDGWLLEQLLGHGGWGRVYKVRRGDEVRAMKVMHPELARDPGFVQRFRGEILTLARLGGHKSLVEIHDFNYAADVACWYLLMAFIDGLSLEQYLLKKGPLTVGQARGLFLAAADGLAAAHGRGVIHRDIQPDNILLARPNGLPVLVDFGLAALADGSGRTRTGQSAGYTPMFAAPEQLHGEPATARSDVYSLAATLYYALLYDKPDLREPYCFEPEHVPEALREVLTRSMHRRPEKRPANAGEFRALLEKPAAPPPKVGDSLRESPANRGAIGPLSPPQRKAGDLCTNSVGMKFAWIPPGTFFMGSPPNEPERSDDETQHKVTLTKGFWMGVHQVTQAQWQAVTGSNPSNFKGDGNLPVENVSWDDCAAFCEALGRKDGKAYRLPTEAEWEYACRAGTTTPFHFGATISTDQANYDGNSAYNNGRKGVYRQKTTPVGSFPANAWGLFDMHGNVIEWCQDLYAPYQTGDISDPLNQSNGEARVLRGGSWFYPPRFCRAAFRYRLAPGSRNIFVGCRVLLCLD